ncbi:ubiquinol oxidase subunit II [Microaerobacter geothermalis]|uniref:ubiquinol oxidase subunit II n=1 Tax=Microaerobacter geothermalis TaxID=674972 RepID=UPI001F197BC2|nr:ubiquinol oxidase subunit II [Microaerobacter geothermalis]MCF6093032.1 ubiquinol oxidase subunit II [Microaerobacter geothermalis]
MKLGKLLHQSKVLFLAATSLVLLAGCGRSQYVVLDPAGPVAQKQYDLIILSVILLAVFIIPVLIFFAYVVFRYRDKPGNRAMFKPEWDDNKTLEVIWWSIPILVIGILSFFTVRDTFALSEPPSKEGKPMTIQVTSLDWKWLFLYPEQGIATVNYVKIPTNTAVNFELTTDAPINSFWVPQLGGQKYTLPGKVLNLWLQADKEGSYYGTANNFSGEGFTEMKFQVIAEPKQRFDKWIEQIKETSPELTLKDYAVLRKPGLVEKQQYSSFPPNLFNDILDKNGGQYYKSIQTKEQTSIRQN